MGLNDWITILQTPAADGTVTLDPTEVVRLQRDLQLAVEVIRTGRELLARSQANAAAAIAIAERAGAAQKRAVEMAQDFAALVDVDQRNDS